MRALNRHMRRKLLSFTRRQKWGQLAQIIGLPASLEAAKWVRALPSFERKKIGMTA